MSRFARHDLIPDWRQDLLSSATVVIIGVGALGNEVARILGQAGVGTLLLCDPDRVEESNLSRAVLFRPGDVGRPKVDAARRALAELAPATRVLTREARLSQGVGLAELRDASLVISCLDSRSARLQLAGRCGLVRASMLDGGTHPWGGEIRPYLDPDGPCYGCGLGEAGRAESDVPWSCLDLPVARAVPAAVPSSAIIGTWMSMAAVRFLMKLDVLSGIVKLDAARATMSVVARNRDPSCPMHEPIGPVTLVPISHRDRFGDLRDVLADGDLPLTWEPVQSLEECPSCGFARPSWGLPETRDCPRCGHRLTPRTTMELKGVPSGLTLERLGIAPREILAVRSDRGLSWIELARMGGDQDSENDRVEP